MNGELHGLRGVFWFSTLGFVSPFSWLGLFRAAILSLVSLVSELMGCGSKSPSSEGCHVTNVLSEVAWGREVVGNFCELADSLVFI